jgi:NADH dehydrogenase
MAHPVRVVVLGGGFGGAYCAQALERRLRPQEAEVLVLDRHNFFPFYPLLVEAGTGSVEPRHAVVSIRSFLRRSRFTMGEVLGADLRAGTTRFRPAESEDERVIPFDHLVIALGSVTNLPPVPGLRDLGWQIKSLADAVALRDRAIEMLEAAAATEDPARRDALLHFVIVGANFTGAEVAGELWAFLNDAIRGYPTLERRHAKVTLIDRGDRILSALEPELSAYAAEQLRRRRVELRLGESVSEIRSDRVRLTSGPWLTTRTVIWAAGIAPPPALDGMDLPRDQRGYVECEPDLRVKGFENVWGIGDAAVNSAPDGSAYPATAQHAVRQGQWCARNIAAAIRGRPTEPCRIKGRGSLAALGCRTGVASVMGVKVSGFAAWWLWRTVYLAKMPGVARKVRVALDWTLGLLFPREIVQLGVHRASKHKEGREER